MGEPPTGSRNPAPSGDTKADWSSPTPSTPPPGVPEKNRLWGRRRQGAPERGMGMDSAGGGARKIRPIGPLVSSDRHAVGNGFTLQPEGRGAHMKQAHGT